MSIGRELIRHKKSFRKVLRKEFSYKVKNKGKIMYIYTYILKAHRNIHESAQKLTSIELNAVFKI